MLNLKANPSTVDALADAEGVRPVGIEPDDLPFTKRALYAASTRWPIEVSAGSTELRTRDQA